MKRNNITNPFWQDKHTTYKWRIAFHEAGHAAGIHLNNKARQLPPVFFKIIFKDINSIMEADRMAYQAINDDYIARVEGGRLIELSPDTIDSMASPVKDYIIAFEADIVNLLIGPLAEARYVAHIDDEPFNHKLVNVKALKNYGGDSDLALANKYLQSFFAEKLQEENKLNELFTIAFSFINDDANWAAIADLADYILSCQKKTIYCEEIITTLDQSISHFQRWTAKEIGSENHPIYCPANALFHSHAQHYS
jgi:hypothetical protein